MIQTVTRDTFREAFKALRPDNFTSAGLDALYDYFDQYEADSGEAVELDVIAICCEYSEYTTMAEFQEDHEGVDFEDEYVTIADIRQLTTVIEIPDTDGFIIQDF